MKTDKEHSAALRETNFQEILRTPKKKKRGEINIAHETYWNKQEKESLKTEQPERLQATSP